MSYQQPNNMFSGGGFEASPNVEGTPKTKGRSGGGYQTMTPVTIKQLFNAVQAVPDDVFKVDGHDLNQITVVGSVLSVSLQSTNYSLLVDDGTGKMDVRIWIDTEDNSDYAQKKRAAWKEGIYVRAIGHLRAFNNKKSIVAFRIIPIKNFDEVTYHFLETIYVHLMNTKGEQPHQTFQQQSSYQPQQINAYQTPMQIQPTSTMSELHTAIVNVIKLARSNDGVSISYICQQLRRPEMEIRVAVEWLNSEAHLYTTIDEDHFQTTDS